MHSLRQEAVRAKERVRDKVSMFRFASGADLLVQYYRAEKTMLVTFRSSEAGEMFMMAETARLLLKAIGKPCTARGVIDKSEVPIAVEALERLIQETPVTEEDEEKLKAEGKPLPVSLKQRVWPFIQLLNRTRQAKKEGRIIWEAAADFEG